LAKSVDHLNPIPAQAVCIDALYRETKELIESFIKIGGEVINMESSAFYAASMLCKVESLWIGCVSDSLVGDKWKDWSKTDEMSYQSGLLCREILQKL
jgi:purine-nucleoside phosphorylase